MTGAFKGKEGLVVIFSGTSILRYELGLMGRASTNSLRMVNHDGRVDPKLDPHVHRGSCGHRWPKVAKNVKI